MLTRKESKLTQLKWLVKGSFDTLSDARSYSDVTALLRYVLSWLNQAVYQQHEPNPIRAGGGSYLRLPNFHSINAKYIVERCIRCQSVYNNQSSFFTAVED